MSSRAITDGATMLRRNLRRAARYPGLTLSTVLTPVVLLLLFVGVLGRAFEGGATGTSYPDYATPGILLLTVAAGCLTTSVAVAVDTTSGIVDRFRTMGISRVAVLTGHVLGNTILTLIGMALVVGVALLLGFAPQAGPADWLLAVGLVTAFTLAASWLGVWFGLISPTVEQASNTPMFVLLLPFLGSAFVPTDTMPTAVRWFAEHQPFTPLTETVRSLLMAGRPGEDAWVALAWCLAIGVAAYAGARRAYAPPGAA